MDPLQKDLCLVDQANLADPLLKDLYQVGQVIVSQVLKLDLVQNSWYFFSML